jgi:type II restriction enzyme
VSNKISGKKAENKIEEALVILNALGLPGQQQNERSALTLLSLLGLKPSSKWEDATDPLMGITPMMDFFEKHYGKKYAPNTRETVPRQTVHQFLQAALIVANPDKPLRPTNSPKAVYQIEPTALALMLRFGKSDWERELQKYLDTVDTLIRLYARERDMRRLPVNLANGEEIRLSPGGQNVLVKKIVDDFCPFFTPGGFVIYVGDTDMKWAYFDSKSLMSLGVNIEEHGKMPDVVVHHVAKNWLILIEAVASHGPVNPKRRQELKELFSASTAGLVFVTAFLNRRAMLKYLNDISWETEVWIAESPTHLIHFNGERFLGPYEECVPMIQSLLD